MTTTDGYREKSSDTIIFMCIIEKVTAIGRVTAIGYRPAIGCNIYTGKKKKNDTSTRRLVGMHTERSWQHPPTLKTKPCPTLHDRLSQDFNMLEFCKMAVHTSIIKCQRTFLGAPSCLAVVKTECGMLLGSRVPVLAVSNCRL